MEICTLDGVPPKVIAWHHELLELQTDRKNGCWIWKRSLNWDGYGATKLNGRQVSVHRVAYLLFKGDIPPGLVLRHCCPGGANRACANPDHLELGTRGDNNRDTVARGRRRASGDRQFQLVPETIGRGTLLSDTLIHNLVHKGADDEEIARAVGLPADHVSGVRASAFDNRPTRLATLFEHRYWSKVEKSEECWVWRAMLGAGYGRIRVNGRNVGAHQVSWRLYYGPVKDGLVVCHNCPGGDNPTCVNPRHLFTATQTENLRDRSRKTRLRTPDAEPTVTVSPTA